MQNMAIMAVLTMAVLAGAVTSAPAQEVHTEHCLYGCPTGTPVSNDLIVREIYTLSSNDATKFADWAAYKVTKDTFGPSPNRNWKVDPWLAEDETLEPNPDDYKDANAELETDRGHQVPLTSFAGTPHAQDTNFLSNITPQKADLNQGPWRVLEDKVRNFAETHDIYALTGPVYMRAMPSLPGADESHQIPSGYWKILSVEDASGLKIAAFFFDQDTERGANYCRGLTTVDDIEQKSGLDFFPDLEKATE